MPVALRALVAVVLVTLLYPASSEGVGVTRLPGAPMHLATESPHAVVARALVQDVYERLHARPDRAVLDRVPTDLLPQARRFRLDYPGAIAAPSPNFWRAHRPRDFIIRYVVIHDTESSCASALNWLTNPEANASAHFLVCRDGRIYQLVHVADVAWHAGNTYVNYHSIGIEHEGFAGGPYTEAQYRATASLLRWIDAHMHLNLQWTRNAVMGHENVPGTDHIDPGPGWDWPLFMALLRDGDPYPDGDPHLAMVLWPRAFVRTCASSACAWLGTANWGEQFYVRARLPGWVGIDYAGAAGWLPAAATGSGKGTIVRIATRRALTVRAAPIITGTAVGALGVGQAYASTLVDDTLDHHGWWLIEYAHRYGFVCACGTAPSFHPTPTPTATPRTTVTPTPSPTGTPTPTPTHTPRPTHTPTASATPTPRPMSSPTATPTRFPTATQTPHPTRTPRPAHTPTATPTRTPRPTRTPSPRPTTPTTTPTGTPTPAASPTATPIVTETPTPALSPTPAGSPAPTATPNDDACTRNIC